MIKWIFNWVLSKFKKSTPDRDTFECYYIARHLQDMTYREAKEHCESLRYGKGYVRNHDDGHLDDCWLAYCDAY